MSSPEWRWRLSVPDDEKRRSMADGFSSLPEAIPKPSENLKEVAVAYEKQVSRDADDPEAIDDEGDKQVAIEDGKETSEPLEKAQAKPPRRFYGFRFRTIIICLTVFLLSIALGVGLGVGLGITRHNGATATASSHKPEQVLIGGSLDPAYYSTTGAFNGSGIALAAQSFDTGKGALVVYFQHWTGEIRYMQLSDPSNSWIGGSADEVVALDAKNGTSLSVVSYSINGTNSVHLFYIDTKNRVRERTVSNTTNIWVDGPLNLIDAQASDADEVGLLACWYGTTDKDFQPHPIGIQLWYASNETTFEELEWVGDNQGWGYQQSWTNLNGHSNPGCYSWGLGTVSYVTFVDLDDQVNFYWKDLSSNVIGTSMHPVNQWVNSSIAIPNTLPGSMGYTNYFYAQSSEDYMFRAYNITWAAENTALIPGSGFVVQGDLPLPATHFACTSVPDPGGGNKIMVLYQTIGNDILQKSRNMFGGQWTTSHLDIPHE